MTRCAMALVPGTVCSLPSVSLMVLVAAPIAHNDPRFLSEEWPIFGRPPFPVAFTSLKAQMRLAKLEILLVGFSDVGLEAEKNLA